MGELRAVERMQSRYRDRSRALEGRVDAVESFQQNGAPDLGKRVDKLENETREGQGRLASRVDELEKGVETGRQLLLTEVDRKILIATGDTQGGVSVGDRIATVERSVECRMTAVERRMLEITSAESRQQDHSLFVAMQSMMDTFKADMQKAVWDAVAEAHRHSQGLALQQWEGFRMDIVAAMSGCPQPTGFNSQQEIGQHGEQPVDAMGVSGPFLKGVYRFS